MPGAGVPRSTVGGRRGVSLWRAYPPYRALGLRFEQLADPVHFADDPALAWGFYGHRLALYRSTVPHAGFGMGIERCVSWICGLDHLREAIPYPRMLYRLYP